MFFNNKNILNLLSRKDVSKKIKNFVFNNLKGLLYNQIYNLSAEDVVSYLSMSSLSHEVKLFICDVINKKSTRRNDGIKLFNEELIKIYFNKKGSHSKYIKSDIVPDIIKKEIINKSYGIKLNKVILDEKINKRLRKEIIRVGLSSYKQVELLEEKLSPEMTEYIISNCLEDKYDIKNAIGLSKISDELKIRIIKEKVNMKNIFYILRWCNVSNYDLIFELKEKELSDYLDSLNETNILKIFDDYDYPNRLLEKIIDLKTNAIRNAIKVANKNTLSGIIYKEKNVRIINLILEVRKNTVKSIIRNLYDFQILNWLNIKLLPNEYKEYILKYHSNRIDAAIKKASDYDIRSFLKTKDNNLPEYIQDRIFELAKDRILKSLEEENDSEIISTIRYGSYNNKLKSYIIEKRINKDNIFLLLNSSYLDNDTLLMTLKIKNDVLIEYLSSYSNDELFSLEDINLPDNIVTEILNNAYDLLMERVKLLSLEEKYECLDNEKVNISVKKVILYSIGINEDDINNILLLINKVDNNVLLSNYNNIRDFIISNGINFDSFIQYGSGSKKYINWLSNIINIISNNKEIEFKQCRDYFIDNYYENCSDNVIDEISRFLEFLNGYSLYNDLFIDLYKHNVLLSNKDISNLDFIFKIGNIDFSSRPHNISELSTFKTKLYSKYFDIVNKDNVSLYQLKEIFNNVLFCNAKDIFDNIGGTRALRTLRKDNSGSDSICKYIDELTMYSYIIDMVNDTNNVMGLRLLLIDMFSNIDELTKIQDLFYSINKKVNKLYEYDSNNNLTRISELTDEFLDVLKSNSYGGLVYDLSDKNYCLYAHVLSSKEKIDDVVEGISTGASNFISVSPVSYRGQKYYWDRNNIIIAYDYVCPGNFVCSSISNMGSNYLISSNSSEVRESNINQRGILETSAVIEQNAEALLFREGLIPCGLILPGGREPSSEELTIHKKYNLPFIITQDLHKAIDDPKFVFINDLEIQVDIVDNKTLVDIVEMLKPSVVINKEDDLYTGREVAIFTDCHSMYEPMLAVLEDIRRRGISEIYSLGDNIGLGPNPVEVFDLLDDYGVISIAGNAEYYNTIGVDAFPYLVEDRLDNQIWTNSKLGQKRINELKLYPASVDLTLGKKKIALCHFANDVRWDFKEHSVHTYLASNDTEQFLYTNSKDSVKHITGTVNAHKGSSKIQGYVDALDKKIFGGKVVTSYDAIIQGHSHFELQDSLNETEIYTLRALGMGGDSKEKDNEACYYILKERKDGGFDIDKNYVTFNKNNLLSSIHNSGLPSKDRVLSYVKKAK